MIKTSIGLIILTLLSFTINTKTDIDCETLHKGTFTYGNPKNLVKVIIEGEKHIEYHNDGKYYIKSKIVWVNECEYNMTMTKNTI